MLRYFLCMVLLLGFIAIMPSWVSASAPSLASAIDPCALVAQSDAGQVMHGDAQPVLTRGTIAGKFCHYHSSDQQMNVFVQNVDPQIMKTLPQLGATAVADVGDAAYMFRGSLFVQKGKNVVQINVYSSSLDGKVYTPELMTLGKLAASRM